MRLTAKNWIGGTYAQDEDGNIVNPAYPGACRFCLVGWLLYLHHRGVLKDYWATKRRLRKNAGKALTNFNDSPVTTFEVIRVFLISNSIPLEVK